MEAKSDLYKEITTQGDRKDNAQIASPENRIEKLEVKSYIKGNTQLFQRVKKSEHLAPSIYRQTLVLYLFLLQH